MKYWYVYNHFHGTPQGYSFHFFCNGHLSLEVCENHSRCPSLWLSSRWALGLLGNMQMDHFMDLDCSDACGHCMFWVNLLPDGNCLHFSLESDNFHLTWALTHGMFLVHDFPSQMENCLFQVKCSKSLYKIFRKRHSSFHYLYFLNFSICCTSYMFGGSSITSRSSHIGLRSSKPTSSYVHTASWVLICMTMCNHFFTH